MNSAYYLELIGKYEQVKGSIQGVLPLFGGCDTSINSTIVYLENLVFDDQPFDGGKLSQDLANIAKVEQNLQILIGECSEKISEYNLLYQQALAQERERLSKTKKKVED